MLSATLKKRLDGVAKVLDNAQKAVQPSASVPTPNRASRLIVRNLPFDIAEQDLRALFLPYGPIHSIDIPTLEEGASESNAAERKKPRIKGFAFVWMLSRKDAERAMVGTNGRTVQAGLADTLMSDKQKRKKQRREEKKRNAAEVQEEDDEERADEARSDAQRVIAVDWALSKDKWEKAKAKINETAEEDAEMAGSATSEDDDSEEDAGSESDEQGSEPEPDEDNALGLHVDVDLDSHATLEDEEERSDEDESQSPMKPSLPPPETGTTVFVRNVPFEATEDELRTLCVTSTEYRGTSHGIHVLVSEPLARYDMRVSRWTRRLGVQEVPDLLASGTRRMQTRQSSKVILCAQKRQVVQSRW